MPEAAQPPILHSRKQSLLDFVAWSAQYIKGDEKGEAQLFLDRLFQAFGQKGVLEMGGTLEFRIRKPKEDGGGTSFADLVWKPYVLIEMKKRGEDLARHYRQAFDYWTRLVPNRPQFVILCNFDEFWVYDFETQMDTPKDRVSIADLPERNGALAFLSPIHEKPVFACDQVEVTREAADKLATCFKSMVAESRPGGPVNRTDAQAFILQMLVALFAEDIGLLEQYTVTRLLAECKTKEDSFDILGGLFVAMNSRGNTGGRYKGIPYFNGGLFAQPARLELQPNELNLLRAAAEYKWFNVRPEIFGTLFEHSLDDKDRHAFGQHFTSAADIMKIIGPTIVDPWRAEIEGAKTLNHLRMLLDRIQRFKVLDPACGSGNFLYVAYRELKRLEKRIFDRMEQEFSREAGKGPRMGFLTAHNFYGLDISPLAIELAKVTMVIGRKLAIDELHITENALPLDNLDENFVAMDALIDTNGLPAKWPKADVIIGNPPFLGAQHLKPQRGEEYVNAVRKAYPDVPGMADYCVYWFRKAHDQLSNCTAADSVTGRAGLVGTQNVRNNQSRVGGLDYIVKSGTIIEAVDNQPWSGEANVHVSIVNWVKTQDKKLLPKKRRLWFKVEPGAASKVIRKRGSGSAGKQYELDSRKCEHINSALSDQVDVANAIILKCNAAPQRVFRGQEPGSRGFVLEHEQAVSIINKDSRSARVMFPHLVGRDLLTGSGTPTRWVIDFDAIDLLKAATYTAAFEHIKSTVLAKMQRIASGQGQRPEDGSRSNRFEQVRLSNWWQFRRACMETISVIKKLDRYIVCSRVAKRPIFAFMHPRIRPDSSTQVFAFEDDYSFGILQSNPHWQWFITKCSKLTERFRYTPESVFDTFPWPQKPAKKQIEAVAKAGREVRRVRASALKSMKGGLRALYRTLDLPGKNPLKDAHTALDAAVLDAYGFSPAQDILAQLLALNLEVASRIEKGDPVTAPGVPASYPDPKALITDDCIRAEEE